MAIFMSSALAADEVTGLAKARDAVTLAIDGARYRLAGIDPIEDARCAGEPCAKAAETALAKLVEGETVTCRKLHKVGHGFFLARCRVSGADLAERLLEEGLTVLGEGADVSYAAALDRARAGAKGRFGP